MDVYQIFSLVCAAVTASGVVIGLLISLIKFLAQKKRKINCDFELLNISQKDELVFIVATLNLISQLSIPTSIIRIELIFDRIAIPATHFQTIFNNFYTYEKTKNILLSPFGCTSLENARFECPKNEFKQTAKLKIYTPTRNFSKTISFPPLQEKSE